MVPQDLYMYLLISQGKILILYLQKANINYWKLMYNSYRLFVGRTFLYLIKGSTIFTKSIPYIIICLAESKMIMIYNTLATTVSYMWTLYVYY